MLHSDFPFPSSEPLSHIVKRLERVLPADVMTVGALLRALGKHGFRFLILVLALLNLALFMLPGICFFLGLPMVILSVQMLLGLSAPVFPDFVRTKVVKVEALRKALAMAVTLLEKVEPVVRPRLPILMHPWARKAHYLLALVMSLLVTIPVPLLNMPPTLGLALLMVGLLECDGFFVIAGYVLGGWSLWLYDSLSYHAQSIFG